MEEKKKFDWKNIVILAMLASLVFCLFKIGELSNQYQNLSSAQNINYNNLRGDIDSIYSNVDNKLKKQASLFSGVDYSIGELSVDKMTAPLKVSVVPKVISDDMKLSVTVDGNTSRLTKKGNTFEGTVDVGLFVDYGKTPLLTVETKDGVKTEYLEDIGVSHLYMKFLPGLYATGDGQSSLSGEDRTIELDYSINFDISSTNSDVNFISYKIVEEVNGKEIGRKDITEAVLNSDGFYDSHYSNTYQITQNDNLNIYVVAVDSLGFTHKVCVYNWYRLNDGVTIETMDGNEHIYDKDGKLLFGEKF